MLIEPGEWLLRCTASLMRGEVREADRTSAIAVAEHPDDGRLWEFRGLTLLRTGDREGGCEALETAQVLVPLSPASRCALAECHARAGRRDLAENLYGQLAADPSCPSGLLPAVAAGLGALGCFRAALAACRELWRREPDCHEAIFGQAYYLRRLGAPLARIVDLVSRAHELAPGSSLYRVTLGSILAELDRRDEAYELLRGVDPGSIGCRGCLGRMRALFEQSGDEGRAESCRQRADSIDDDDRDCGRNCRRSS
jgi:tetratricopeptide (TPR) repeat protein